MKDIRFLSLIFVFFLFSLNSYAQCTEVYDLGGTDGASTVVNGVTVTYNEGIVNGGGLGATSGNQVVGFTEYTALSTGSVASVDNNQGTWRRYVWQKLTFSQEVEVGDVFKITDVDGGTQEIAAIFARDNSGTQIDPTMTCGSTTTSGNYSTLNDISGITMGPVQTCRSSGGVVDFDTPSGHASADFGTTKVKEVYFLFGVYQNTSATHSQQVGIDNGCFEDYLCVANAPTTVTASPSTVCEGSSSSLTGTCASGETIRWYSADSSTATLVGSGTPFSVSPTTDSTYYAYCYNTSGSCTSTTGTPVSITVQSSPTITDILAPICTSTTEGMVTFQTSGGASSTVTVDNGYSATFDSDGRFNDTRQVWVVENVASSATINVTVTENGCSVVKSYTMPDCAGMTPLPVNIIDFDAVQLADNIAIEWTVSKEASILDFDVMKSNNAINFELIGSVKALNKSEKHKYTFLDQKKYGQASYYKLAINEADGNKKFTAIIAEWVDTKEAYSVYPVPASGEFLQVEALNNQNIKSMRMLSNIGDSEHLKFKKVTEKHYELDIRKVQNGIYLLEIDNGTFKEVKRVIIQK